VLPLGGIVLGGAVHLGAVILKCFLYTNRSLQNREGGSNLLAIPGKGQIFVWKRGEISLTTTLRKGTLFISPGQGNWAVHLLQKQTLVPKGGRSS